MPSAAVVGAGVTGLSCAHRLARLGSEVTLYEATDRVGGVVRSVRRDGYLAECGPNSLADPPPPVAALLSEIGLDDRRIDTAPAARKRYVLRDGKLVPLPLSLPELLTSPLFSARGKLALAREPFVRPGDPTVDESVAAFVRRRLGQEVLDYAASPIVGGIYAGDPEVLSIQHALPRLYSLEREHGSIIRGAMALACARRSGATPGPPGAIRSFRHGMQEIPDALAGQLEGRIALRTRVRAICREGRRWTVTSDRGDARHDAVIYAGAAHALSSVRLDLAGGERLAELAAIPHPPVSVLVLGFPRHAVEHPLDGFGLLVPAAERRKILGVVFSSTLFPDRAPAGYVTLSVFVGGTRQPDLATGDAPALTRLVRAELGDILGVAADPTFVHHVFWPRAIPQYVLGYGRYQQLLDEVERDNPGLFLAGSYRHGVALGDAMKSGLETAQRAAVVAGSKP